MFVESQIFLTLEAYDELFLGLFGGGQRFF